MTGITIALLAGLFVSCLVTIASLAAWFGIYREREDDRARLMRGSWECDYCGRTMRYVGDTVEHGA